MESKQINDPTRVPVLHWSSNVTKSNFHDWKEKLLTYGAMNYKYMAYIIENSAEFPIPALNIPNGAKMTDLEKINYQSELNQRYLLTNTISQEKLPFFTFMIEHLSENSKTILMRDKEFSKICTDKDVKKLWDLIVNTHSILGGGQAKSMIPGEIDRELMENLDGVKMSAMESLSTYLKRFNNAIKAYVGTTVTAPEVPFQVAIFLRNLEERRFGDFKTQIRSDFHQAGVAYPKDINEAFLRTSNWELDHPTPQHRSEASPQSTMTSTSYHTSTQVDSRGRGENHYVCDLCGEIGHYTNRCPRLADAKEAIKRSPANTFHVQVQEANVFSCPSPSETDILLDTQSTHHLFKNAKLLQDLHISPTTIQVQGQVEGASFSTDAVGRFLNLEDEVFHSRLARANVLSFSRIWKQFPILIDSVTKSLTVELGDHRMVFKEENGLFIHRGGVNPEKKPKLRKKRKKDNTPHFPPHPPPSHPPPSHHPPSHPPPISPSQLSTKEENRKNEVVTPHSLVTLHPSSREEKREEKKRSCYTSSFW
jgi:hypothetical protein